MTTEYMKEFATLAKVRNYSVAADALGTTQASLSRHIQAMEDELGLRLFERSTRRVELTLSGLRFLHYARKSVSICDECTVKLSEAFYGKEEATDGAVTE